MEDFRSRSLAIRELVLNLKECGLPVTELEFHKPNSSRALDLYTFFFKLLDPWNIPTYRDLLNNASDRLQIATIDQTAVFNAIEDITIYGFLQEFLSMISFPDFELQDILTPTSPRHVSIILTLNNFTVHAIHCKRQMKPLFESMTQKADRIDQLKEEKSTVTALFVEGRKKKEEDDYLAIVKSQENEKIHATLFEYRKEADVNGLSLKSDRNERQRLKDNLSGVHYALMDCKRKSAVFKDNMDIDVEKLELEIDGLDRNTEQVRQEQVKEQQALHQNKATRSVFKTKSDLVEQIKHSAAEIKRHENEVKRLGKSLESMEREKEVAMDGEKELKRIDAQIVLEMSTTEFEIEKCEEQGAKLEETRKIYWDKMSKEDEELQEKLIAYRDSQDAFNEESKIYLKQINEILGTDANLMEQLAPKIDLLGAQVERLLLLQSQEDF